MQDYSKKLRVAMLVSGGVDSSVALNLLVQEGYDVEAFYLKIWLEDEMSFLGTCPWEEDLSYVRPMCEKLGVKLTVLPFQKEYHDQVIAYTLGEISKGRTPNPDVLCNTFIKFGAFLDTIGKDFDYVATGHYAQMQAVIRELLSSSRGEEKTVTNSSSILEKNHHFTPSHGEGSKQGFLKKSPDRVKDQTYFLSRLRRDQIERAMFPIGGYKKEEVRKMAEQFDLPTKGRPDSQGLCFLGEINYNDFVKFHFGEQDGDIINIENGEILGKHMGYWFHTIGQRKGLDLPQGPWYVVGKDVENNIVYVSHRLHMVDHEKSEFEVEDVKWFVDENFFLCHSDQSVSEVEESVSHKTKIVNQNLQSCQSDSLDNIEMCASKDPFFTTASDRGGIKGTLLQQSLCDDSKLGIIRKESFLTVKVRHGAKEYPCEVEKIGANRYCVRLFEDKERGIAPGQFAVFYAGEICLGSGIIAIDRTGSE